MIRIVMGKMKLKSSNSVFFARLPLTPLPPCTHLSSPTSFQCWRLLKGHGGTFGHFVILSLQCLRLQPPNFANPNLFIEPTFFPLFSLQLMGSNGRTGANTFAKEVTTPLAFWENKNIFGLGEIQDGEGSLPPTLHRRPQLRPRTAETLSASCQRYYLVHLANQPCTLAIYSLLHLESCHMIFVHLSQKINYTPFQLW